MWCVVTSARGPSARRDMKVEDPIHQRCRADGPNSIQSHLAEVALQGNSRHTAPGGRYVIKLYQAISNQEPIVFGMVQFDIIFIGPFVVPRFVISV